MPGLLFYRGDERLLEYRLRPGRTSIGRADFCDVSLPGESISRTHCIIEGSGRSWRLIDRSRHGTTIDGHPAGSDAALIDGSRIGIGEFSLVFRDADEVAPPTSDAVPPRTHEELLGTRDAVTVSQALLEVVEGEGKGERFYLSRPRMSVGGPGSSISLPDPSLLRDHCRLRVSRGRVMLEPGAGPIWLDGRPVRDITPVLPDEEVRIGACVLRVGTEPRLLSPESDRFGEMVGRSRPMRQVFGLLKCMAAHDDPILIIGESGTGKELAAHGIHQHSPRAEGPFIPINCGAIAAELFESELFGHLKGSFTGATADKPGAFQEADGGTLFLDELGELPLEAQSKLLRVLSGGGVRRVGSFKLEHPDVRVVAATNRDLVQMVRAGTFRSDLFFRLETLFVQLPPVRRRGEDIAQLAQHLASRQCPDATIAPDAMAVLRAHPWPGNVRELHNVLRRAIVLHGPRVTAEALTFHSLGGPAPTPQSAEGDGDATEPEVHARVRRRHDGNRSSVARELGLSRSGLIYRMKRLGLM